MFSFDTNVSLIWGSYKKKNKDSSGYPQGVKNPFVVVKKKGCPMDTPTTTKQRTLPSFVYGINFRINKAMAINNNMNTIISMWSNTDRFRATSL